MSANDDNQLNQHLDQHQQQQGADQQVDEPQQVDEEEVTDLQLELEEAAQLGHVELLERVPVQRLVDFEHSDGRKGGEWLLEEATKHGQGGVVQCLVRRSVESGRDFVRGWTVGHAAAFAGDLKALRRLTKEQLSATAKGSESLLHAAARGGHVDAIQWLVKRGANPMKRMTDGYTTIHLAAANGHAEAIGELVRLGAKNIDNTVWSVGETSLHFAARRGQVEAIERLAQLRADVNKRTKNSETCLHFAAMGGHVAAIDALVGRGADMNAANKNGETCLHFAASGGHVEAIERLVGHGADVHAANKNGETCLHFAASGGHVEAIEWLVGHGADVHAANKNGETCLHIATSRGHMAAVKRLVHVELEADVNVANKNSETCLHIAASGGHVAAIDALVGRGADMNVMNENGETCLHVAAARGHVAAIERLVELKADVNAASENGETCLHFAASGGHVEAIEWLVACEAHVNAANKNGDTCLHIAVARGHVAVVERLVELDADPLATTKNGNTCLHIAAKRGDMSVVGLVERLVDPDARNNNGETCLHVAALGGHVTAIERLLYLGADPALAHNALAELLVRKTKEADVAAMKQLVDVGVDPNATTNAGRACLTAAAEAGHAEATAFLLLLGADPSATTIDGRTRRNEAVTLLRAESGWLMRRCGVGVPAAAVDRVERLSRQVGPVVALAALGSVDSSRLDQVLAVWPQLQSLEVLCLRGLVTADFARLLDRLSELSGLRRLFLGGVEGETLHVSASQLAAIASLPLTALELSHVSFEDAAALRGCTLPTSLTLSSCTLSSADLDAIASLPQLQRLDLRRARFPSLDALVGGCVALRSLDVRDCGLTSAPAILASLPRLQQLFVLGNPFVDELQEYGELLADAASAVDFFRAQSLSSESKTRDVPVVMVGHGRAGKSQVIRALLHEPQAEQGAVEHVELVLERTSKVESGVHKLSLSRDRSDRGTNWETQVDEFEARFFDTPGQMEFFASNMAVIAPLFRNSVALVVVRCVPHGVDGTDISLFAEKKRIAFEFRLWLSEVSRAVVRLGNGADAAGKSAKVLLVLTHRDVLEQAQGEAVVEDVVAWLDSLGSELRVEFSKTLEVQDGIHFVNGTLASESGHGVAPLRERLATMAHRVFKSGPLLPGALVDARAFVVSDEVRRLRVCEVKTLEQQLTSRFGERGLTPRLSRHLLEVLESNGSVLRTPGRRLVVVDPDWISRVMSSLYVDPKLHDAVGVNGDPSKFDALAAFDEDGEVGAADLEKHLRRFAGGDDALLERLLQVLVSHGIVIPLRVRPDLKGVPVVESYLIVGRWMDTQDGDGCVQWNSLRQDEASWFELVTGRRYSLQNAASAFALAPSLRDQRPSFYLTSLRCETRVPLGPAFLTRLVHCLAQLFHSSRHSFLVRRTDFACVLRFTRFHAALHVRLSSSANTFELTLVAARDDAEAALQFVLRRCVFYVLKMLALGEHDVWLRVKQRCNACVATREDLTSHAHHDRELASGEAVRDDEEAVRALFSEVMGDGHNWQYDECRGRDGALSTVEVELVNPKLQSRSFGDSFVPDIPPTSIKLDEEPRVLGSGQFGSVLMGEYNGTEVVLKELKVPSPAALAAFKREAELLGRASRYPCISLLLGMCRMGEAQVYLVMERAGVCDLGQALCKPPAKPLLGAAWEEFGVLVGLLADVASALRHMHSQDPPIVHNDVALRNVLVRYENGQNRAKLTDMGLACAAPRGCVQQLGRDMATPKWQMAPETLRSHVVSPASDVYQFGNLVYEMLARERPFEREHCGPDPGAWASLVEQIKNGRRPLREDIEAAGAHCDDWLWQLLEECWRDNPQTRPTMVQVSARLGEYVRDHGRVPLEQTPLGRRARSPDDDSDPDSNSDEDTDTGESDSASTDGDDEEDDDDDSSDYGSDAGGDDVDQGEPVPDNDDDDDDNDDDDDDDDDEAKQSDSTDEAENPLQDTSAPAPPTISTLPPPAHVSDWTVDDVCAWLLQLASPACVELVPLFRHQGVKGTVLIALEIDDLTELDIRRMTAKVLLQARDELLSPPE